MSLVVHYKISSVIVANIYFNSNVTSFAEGMKPYLPVKVNSKIDKLATTFKKLSQSEYFKMLPTMGVIEAAVHRNAERLADRGAKFALRVDEKFSDVLGDHLEFTGDSTTSDVIGVTLADLKEFAQEVGSDMTTGIIDGVQNASVKYIDQTFQETEVHRAILEVLVSSLKEDTFVAESRQFGIDLINEALNDQEFKDVLKNSSIEVVQDKSVKNASIDLMKDLVNHNTIQYFTKSMMNDAITKTGAIDVLQDSMVEGVIMAVKRSETNDHIGKLFKRVSSIDLVQEEAKKSVLYKNLYSQILFWSSHTKSDISSVFNERLSKWIRENDSF